MRTLRAFATLLAAAVSVSVCVCVPVLSAQEPARQERGKSPGKGSEKAEEKRVDWDALFKMHYENRVRAFRDQNLAFQNVVLLGDSITEGFTIPQYFPGRRIINRGIGADIIGTGLPADDHRGVLRRLDCSVFDCAATDVFLMIGVNDLNANRKLDVMQAGYREILQRIRDHSPSIRVHVQSLLPTRGNFATKNAEVKEFNRRIKRLAEEFGYKYMDLHSLFVDRDGELKAEFTADGLHLTEPAYQIWRAEIEKAMGWQTGGK